MMRPDINAILNRLLVTLYRSFPMYLGDTGSAVIMPAEAPIKQTVQRIAADYRRYAQQLVELIQDRRSQPDFGDFPLVFTDTHDLSFEYLLSELVYYQKQDISMAQACVRELASDPMARALAEEILGNMRGHLESLESLAGSSSAKPLAIEPATV